MLQAVPVMVMVPPDDEKLAELSTVSATEILKLEDVVTVAELAIVIL